MIKINKYSIPYIIILILLGFKGNFILAFILAMLHEFIHYVAAVLLGFEGFNIEILPIGTVLNLENFEYASLKQDFIISISAPLFNILMGIFFCLIKIKIDNYFIDYMIKANFSLGFFNLIPAFPLDGGRVLKDVLLKRRIYKTATNTMILISIIIGFIMMSIYIFLFINGEGKNINVGIISGFIIISSLKEKERIPYIIMGDLVKKKNKFFKNGYIENVGISVYYKTELIKALSMVVKNKYNIFTVLDMDMKLMGIIYEEEILEALKKYGNITFEEFIKSRSENA